MKLGDNRVPLTALSDEALVAERSRMVTGLDSVEAVETLKALCGHTHQVFLSQGLIGLRRELVTRGSAIHAELERRGLPTLDGEAA